MLHKQIFQKAAYIYYFLIQLIIEHIDIYLNMFLIMQTDMFNKKIILNILDAHHK